VGRDRPREHARVLGIAELELAHDLCECVDEAVRDLAMHEHALGAGAALPRREVAADDDLVDCLAHGRVLEDDRDILAAHLERDEQLRPIDARFEDAATDGPAAREAQTAQMWRRDHRCTDRRRCRRRH